MSPPLQKRAPLLLLLALLPDAAVAPCPGAGKCGDSPVPCSYVWSAWGACSTSPPYQQSRDIVVYQHPKHGGMPCPESPAIRECPAVDCQGYWSAWGACDDSTLRQTRRWITTTHKQGDGKSCTLPATGADASTAMTRPCEAPDPNRPKRGCAYTWSDWSSCSLAPPYEKSRTINVMNAPENGGAECPVSPEVQPCPPVDCSGRWSPWSSCADANLTQTRTWKITQPALFGGTACPFEGVPGGNVAKRRCQIVSWQYYRGQGKGVWDTPLLQRRPLPNSTELEMVACPVGTGVELRWSSERSGSGAAITPATMHDVWQLPTADDFDACSFDGRAATKLAPETASSSVTISCPEVGTRYFACSVQGACAKGFQRLRVHVFDPSRVVSTAPSLGRVFMQDLIALTYNEHALTKESDARRIMSDLEAIAENAPSSCADWIPDAQNTEEACRAFAETDMGFIERIRPQPDRAAAELHYAAAIRLKPEWCGAQAYRAELLLEEEAKGRVDAKAVNEQYQRACAACGSGTGLLTVQIAFVRRGRQIPECSREVEEEEEEGDPTRTEGGGDGAANGNPGVLGDPRAGQTPSGSSGGKNSDSADDGEGWSDYDPDDYKQSGIPWTYILVPVLVVCGVPCLGFWCMYRCARSKDDFNDYGESDSDSEMEGDAAVDVAGRRDGVGGDEMDPDDIILEMVKEESARSAHGGGGGGGGGGGVAGGGGGGGGGGERGTEKKRAKNTVIEMMQRIRSRTGQSRSRSRDHITLDDSDSSGTDDFDAIGFSGGDGDEDVLGDGVVDDGSRADGVSGGASKQAKDSTLKKIVRTLRTRSGQASDHVPLEEAEDFD